MTGVDGDAPSPTELAELKRNVRAEAEAFSSLMELSRRKTEAASSLTQTGTVDPTGRVTEAWDSQEKAARLAYEEARRRRIEFQSQIRAKYEGAAHR